MRAVFVGVFKRLGVLAEDFATLLAGEDHFCALLEWVVFGFVVAVRAVEPFPA
jgi:hypothetical protein